jgi:hypothetical protein
VKDSLKNGVGVDRNSSMDLTTFAEALEGFREAELIARTCQPEQEFVALSPYGELVAGARP